jgi:signal transduction histidine kinase
VPTTKRRRETPTDAAREIRRAATRLGFSTRETRELVRVVQPGASESLLATKLGDLLVDRSLEHGWAAENIWALLDVVADVADVDEHRLALSCHSRAARNPSLLALSPHLAVEMHVRMLYVLTPASDVSVWTTSAGGGLQSTAHAGGGEPTRRARLVARDLLDGSAPALGLFTSIPVLRWQRTEAALVVKSEKEWRQTAALAAEDTAAALTPVLEREALLARNATRERALVATGERLLTRIGFDLHDGPIQDLSVVAGDIRLFKARLADAGESVAPGIVAGFLDDLGARIESLDRGLRDAIHSLESPAVAQGPVEDSLRREIESFEEQSGIAVDLTVAGDLEPLTASQRIAIVRLVQESMSNARDHAGAKTVSVSLLARPDGTTLEIMDDGRGFDVPRTLVRAARRGRFGLLGMSERVRLLGGRFDVQSQKGGPTLVSARLPIWQPAVHSPADLPAALI